MAETVTVACKIPNGLFLDLKKGAERIRVRLNGPAMPVLPEPGKPMPKKTVEHAVGLTFGVDKEFWEAWCKENPDFGPMKQGLLYAAPKGGDVVARAKGEVSNLTGMEPLNPDKPAPGIKKFEADK